MTSAMTSAAAARRERIIHAAVEVFAANGYEAGSVNDVAAAAGMSRHNLFYYFSTKRDLLLAVLDSRDAELNGRLQWMEAAADIPLSEFTDNLVAIQPQIYRDRDLMRLYHRLTAEASDPAHPAHEWVRSRHARLREASARLLSAAQRRGELNEDLNPAALAVALLGAIEGIEAQWLVDESLNWEDAVDAVRLLMAMGRV